MEDLGPADMRVLLQAEEELGQVLLMSQCFTPARDIIGNKADVTMFYTRLNLNLPNVIATSSSSASNGRECFPNPTPHLTIFSCQRLGELKEPASISLLFSIYQMIFSLSLCTGP